MPFVTQDLTAIPFARSSGTTRQDLRYAEPGQWWNNHENALLSGCYPAVTMVVDAELGGTSPNTGVWTATVTPLTTQNGSPAADGMAAASITYTSAAETLAQNVAALVAALTTATELEALADLTSWNRFRSYVALSISPVSTAKLRATSVQPGMTFSLVLTGPAGNTVAYTTIASPSTSVLSVGTYCAIDRTLGSNGFNANGQPYLTLITSATAVADIVGPVYLGVDTEALEAGDLFREYTQGHTVPVVAYGDCLAFADSVIAASSTDKAVYVRHTASGNYVSGCVTDATGAAVGATANVWTGTPTAVNDVVYTQQIIFGDVVQLLTFLADGSATATEIVTGLKAQLALHTGVGGRLYGLVGSGTTTFIITGPSDGRGFTPSSNGTGVLAWVETTAEVATHRLLTRGDKFGASHSAIGSVPVSVPHSNA